MTKPLEPRTLKGIAQDQLLNGVAARVCEHSPGLKRLANRYVINSAIDTMPPRPYRLSTMDEYTSWDSLTDRSYSVRELDAVPAEPPTRPPEADVVELFRRSRFRESEKSTVLFAYVAQWFTDGFLRSPRFDKDGKEIIKDRDVTRNDSTHQVDLAQVYGLTADATTGLRRGRWLACQEIDGQQYPPALFSADGERLFPELRMIGDRHERADPREFLAMGSDASNSQIGFAMLNTLYLRAHNTIADEIAAHEPGLSDERVFRVTRNVLIVLTIKLVMQEYINHITPWRFQIEFDRKGFDRVRWHRQNWAAVEFNLLYRWHCLIPPTLHVHGQALDPSATIFRTRSLLTGGNGLGELLDEASGQRAGAIELFNTGEWLLGHGEAPTIAAARTARVGTYNQYRVHCGFKPVKRFEDLSSDANVVAALRDRYRSMDELEFYPGLYAEDRPRNSVVGPLMGRMVAVHAFSQLLTNPLLAPAIYDNDDTFTPTGRGIIRDTRSIQEVVDMIGLKGHAARLTHADWSPQ